MKAWAKAIAIAVATLLAIAGGYQSGAEKAKADVGPFGSIYAQDGRNVLTVSGEVWQFDCHRTLKPGHGRTLQMRPPRG